MVYSGHSKTATVLAATEFGKILEPLIVAHYVVMCQTYRNQWPGRGNNKKLWSVASITLMVSWLLQQLIN